MTNATGKSLRASGSIRAEDGFTFARNPARIAAEARLDGFYVIRTSVEDKALAGDRVVAAYKDLARVERAFRSLVPAGTAATNARVRRSGFTPQRHGPG